MNNPAITALITVQESSSYYLRDAHFKKFGEKQMFQLMIDKLLAVPAINRVVVTTDSDVVRKMYGGHPQVSLIDFPHPDTFSADPNKRILEEMPTSDRMTANSLQKTDGAHFMQTQCINPLLSIQTIAAAIERYYTYVINDEDQQFDSVMSLYRIEKRLYSNSDYPKITLRDDPHFVIYEDTVFNIFNRQAFVRNNQQKFGKNPMFYDVSELENLTVETPTGYQLARLAYDNQALFV
jgi:CMP-N-acetylneuraminic acid synthetase